MCGIAGILYRDRQRPVDPQLLQAMGDAIAHRGPDAEGLWYRTGVGLVHRRLSIIDLESGDQPIANEDGSVQVVFNGEIYNYRQLRAGLESHGHRFATTSDTETLVHLYEEHQAALVDHLRGMFAFALWDEHRARLLLARDRVGLKPLYIYRDSEKLLFASELKAILAWPDVQREIDPHALEDYLAFGFVPGGRAIFKNTEKLPPGHLLSIGRDDWNAAPRRYWQLQFQPVDDSLDVWLERIDDKLRETVAAHAIADVPVGAFLSGGLDSSVIVAALSADPAAKGIAPLETFSIGFEEDRYNELPYARRVAKQFGTAHTEEIVTVDALDALDRLAHHYDEPFADPSAMPTMAVSRLARERVKVVLSGDGGDEAFGGYSRYAHDLVEARVRASLPRVVRRVILASLARVWPQADWLPRRLRAKNTLANLALDDAAAYANTLTLCRLPLRRQLLESGLRASLGDYRPESQFIERYRGAAEHGPLSGMLATDIAYVLPDGFLVKVDRASMAYGLEVRPPLVDHELLELSAQIPAKWKIDRGETKWLLKRLYDQRLPHDVVWRPKHGFDLPVDEWFRGELGCYFADTVLPPNTPIGDYLHQKVMAGILRAHQSGLARHGRLLWAILMFGLWAQRYLRPAPRPAAAIILR